MAAIWASEEWENLHDMCLKTWSRDTLEWKKEKEIYIEMDMKLEFALGGCRGGFGTLTNAKIPTEKVVVVAPILFDFHLHLGNFVENGGFNGWEKFH